eukprot:GHVN01105706.1.p1 GENE.GHVN01105706.1~~GHVN01105706.1.p1  ORF type:complete len:284 (-),score=36.73 GHVN01105706.1:52-903(-)
MCNSRVAEECSICFEKLCDGPVAGFFNGNRRVCVHSVHHSCGQALQRSSHSCPVCRQHFNLLQRMPDPMIDTRKWFAFVDLNGDGKLTKDEVVWALSSILDAEKETIRAGIEPLWLSWDRDRSSCLELSELTEAQFSQVPQLLSIIKGHRRARVPIPVFKDARHWFYYWDANRSRSLDFEEVYRALCLTFKISPFRGKDGGVTTDDMRAILTAMWEDIDRDHSGTISEAEFCRPNGLWEMVASNALLPKQPDPTIPEWVPSPTQPTPPTHLTYHEPIKPNRRN